MTSATGEVAVMFDVRLSSPVTRAQAFFALSVRSVDAGFASWDVLGDAPAVRCDFWTASDVPDVADDDPVEAEPVEDPVVGFCSTGVSALAAGFVVSAAFGPLSAEAPDSDFLVGVVLAGVDFAVLLLVDLLLVVLLPVAVLAFAGAVFAGLLLVAVFALALEAAPIGAMR